MSVLIKGMEMPKTCEECALNYDSFSCIRTGSSFFRDNDSEFDPFKARLEDCPLVPVPEHGRLIEADALTRAQGFHNYKYDNGLMYVEVGEVVSLIKAAPTIIPAEEET